MIIVEFYATREKIAKEFNNGTRTFLICEKPRL